MNRELSEEARAERRQIVEEMIAAQDSDLVRDRFPRSVRAR